MLPRHSIFKFSVFISGLENINIYFPHKHKLFGCLIFLTCKGVLRPKELWKFHKYPPNLSVIIPESFSPIQTYTTANAHCVCICKCMCVCVSVYVCACIKVFKCFYIRAGGTNERDPSNSHMDSRNLSLKLTYHSHFIMQLRYDPIYI